MPASTHHACKPCAISSMSTLLVCWKSHGECCCCKVDIHFTKQYSLQIDIASASSANPGIPPSSLMSLLRVKPGIAGIVLAEFDRAFSNPYYNSHLDHAENLYAESLTAAAEATARALHVLASHVQPHMALEVSCRHAAFNNKTRLSFLPRVFIHGFPCVCSSTKHALCQSCVAINHFCCVLAFRLMLKTEAYVKRASH